MKTWEKKKLSIATPGSGEAEIGESLYVKLILGKSLFGRLQVQKRHTIRS